MKTLFKRFLRREIGFTLVELAIAMLVVGVLSTIAVPAFLGVRNAGYDKEAHDQLMTANLIRTLAWTVCGACSIWIVLSTWASDQSE